MKIFDKELFETTFITSEQINTPPQQRAHRGLSQELIEELSDEVTDGGIINLVSIELEPNKWYNLSSSPTEFAGVDERGNPIYKHVYNGVDYLAYPFKYIMVSERAGGEIVAGSLQIANYDEEIALALENPIEALNVIVRSVSRKTGELINETQNLKLTSITNTISEITGDLTNNDILNEPLPTARYYNTNFTM